MILFLKVLEKFDSSGLKGEFSNFFVEVLIDSFADEVDFLWERELIFLPCFFETRDLEIDDITFYNLFDVLLFIFLIDFF